MGCGWVSAPPARRLASAVRPAHRQARCQARPPSSLRGPAIARPLSALFTSPPPTVTPAVTFSLPPGPPSPILISRAGVFAWRVLF